MANKKFNSFMTNLAKGVFNLETDVLKVMLVTTAYVASSNIDTDTITEAQAGEVSGTAYVAGGATLANKSVTQDNANDQAVLDADDVVWPSSSITAGGAVIYKDGSNELLCLIDFGGEQVSASGDFTINWNAGGILTLS